MRKKKFNGRFLAALGVTVLLAVFLVWVFIATNPKIDDCCTLQGNGTKENPYLVGSAEELAMFRDFVNDGMSFDGKFIRQTADIDLGEEEWEPIGLYDSGRYFSGLYDGDGHVIRNLVCTKTSRAGLFGQLNGEVRNLGIESGFLAGDYAGGIACLLGTDKAVVLNCYNKAKIQGVYRAAGTAQNCYGGRILYCFNLGEVTCDTGIAGGICANDCRELRGCYSVNAPVVSPDFIGSLYESEAVDSDEMTNGFVEQACESMYRYLKEAQELIDDRYVTVRYLKASGQTVTFGGKFYQPSAVERDKMVSFIAAYAGGILLCAASGMLVLVLLRSRRVFRNKKEVIEKGISNVGNNDAAKEEDKAAVEGETQDAGGGIRRSLFSVPVIRIAGVVLFSTFLIAGYHGVNRTLMYRTDNGILSMENYDKQEDGTVDVLLIGSSKVGYNLDCSVLWEEYGISGYALWAPSQPMWNSYYYLKEALKTTKPKVVVLDVTTATYSGEYSIDGIQCFNLFGMDPSLDKVEAIQATAPQERWINLLLGFPIYHTRYTQVTQSMFRRLPWKDDEAVEKGHGYDVPFYRTGIWEQYGIKADLESSKKITYKEELYLRKIIDLCREEDISLTLIHTSGENAGVTRVKQQPYYNDIQSMADEYGLQFLNYDLLEEEIGLLETDIFVDNIHINRNGARKVTSHLGNYLMEHYGLPDHRGDENYQSWETYSHWFDNRYYPKITGREDYIKELAGKERIAVFIKRGVKDEDGYFELFLQQATECGLDLSFLRQSGDGCWVMPYTVGNNQVTAYDISEGGALTFGNGKITVDFENGGEIQFGDKTISGMPRGVICMVYDPYMDEAVDICQIFSTGEANINLVEHY